MFTLLTHMLVKNVSFFSPGLRSCFSAHPRRIVLRPVQCCFCLHWSSLGSGWSYEWNIPQGLKFCPICSHVDLQIFPPVWDFWHPEFPGCAYIIPVRRRTWLYGLECALCNWTSSLKNTPAILPVLVWGYEVCDVALWAVKEEALPRGCSWADLITLGFEIVGKEKSEVRNKSLKQRHAQTYNKWYI